MSKSVGLLAAAVLLLLSGGLAYLARQPIPEKLLAVEPVLKLGERSQGEVIDAEFVLVNHCKCDIEIVNVVKSCSCSAYELAKSSLQSGEKTTLKVKWRTHASRGDFYSDLAIVYDKSDGGRDTSRVRLEADVVPDIRYEPVRLSFETGKKGEQVVAFFPGHQPDVTVVRAYCTHRAFQAQMHADSSGVRVTFDPALWPPDGPRVDLVVETTSPNEPVCRLPLVVVEGAKPSP
jgi:hypothetical protein